MSFTARTGSTRRQSGLSKATGNSSQLGSNPGRSRDNGQHSAAGLPFPHEGKAKSAQVDPLNIISSTTLSTAHSFLLEMHYITPIGVWSVPATWPLYVHNKRKIWNALLHIVTTIYVSNLPSTLIRPSITKYRIQFYCCILYSAV